MMHRRSLREHATLCPPYAAMGRVFRCSLQILARKGMDIDAPIDPDPALGNAGFRLRVVVMTH